MRRPRAPTSSPAATITPCPPAGWTARAVAANATVIQPSEVGYLTFHAGDSGPETTSTLTFAAGQLRSNNAIVPLAFDGTGTLAVTPFVVGAGSVHLTVDVSGWFE